MHNGHLNWSTNTRYVTIQLAAPPRNAAIAWSNVSIEPDKHARPCDAMA